MEMKETFKMVNNIPIPQDAKFVDDRRIEVTFKAPFNEYHFIGNKLNLIL